MILPVIPISCEGCGLCCMHLNTPPFTYMNGDKPKDAELERQIKDYIMSIRFVDEDSPCIWLDRSNGRCLHYEQRPKVCREFELGSESCLKFREEYERGK